MRIFKSTFAKMPPSEQQDNLIAWERDAAEGGLEPADRARGRRMLKQLKQLWEEFFPMKKGLTE